jgi:Flp pilus assembly protein TadD
MVVNELLDVTRPEQAEQRSRVLITVISLLLLATAIAGVFARACAYPFVDWDDGINVSLNSDLNPPRMVTLERYWRSPQLGMYIPVVYSAWAGLATVPHAPMRTVEGSTLNPSVFHTANLVVHFLSSVLVWQILRRLLPTSPRKAWAALAGAMLFALHPLQVEPVVWITGLKDLLSGLFALSALFLYILAVQSTESRQRNHRRFLLITATLSYAAALLSKPSATCVPLMALVIDRVIFHRPWKKSLPLLALWGAMAIVLVVVTQSSQVGRLFFRPSWDLRPFVAMDSIGFYLAKLLLPIRLGIDHGRSPVFLVENGTLQWSWIPGLVFCLGVWLSRRRFAAMLVPALLFLAGIAPTLGLALFEFQNISTVADRFVYMAMLGPALLLAQLMLQSTSWRTWAACGIVLLTFAILSFAQAGFWHDDLSLITHALEVNPQSEVMTEKLATAISDTGDLDRGDTLYRQALALRWNDVAATVGLGSNMHKRHRLEAAAAYLHRAVLIDPQNADARFNYGNVLFDQRKLSDAIDQYRIALHARPRDPRILVNLGTALAISGNWSQSESVFRAALDAAPESAMAHSGLGRVLEQRGDRADALAEYQKALELQPELAAAIKGKSRLLQKLQN